MATKGIGFKGIERVNSKTTSNEGACEEIINLRYEGNSWRSVSNKKLLDSKNTIILPSGVVEYKVVIQPCSQDKYYIAYLHRNIGVTTRRISLFDVVTGEKADVEDLLLLEAGESLLNISYLHNVLIVNTSTRKVYYLWKYDKYLRFEQGEFNIGTIKSTGRSEGLIKAGTPAEYFRDNNTDWVESFRSKMLAAHTAMVLDGQRYNLFEGLSFIRFAVKLYDGSYIYQSNITFADTNGDSILENGSAYNNGLYTIKSRWHSAGAFQYRYATALKTTGTIDINISFNNLSRLKELMDIGLVTSVDVFMTRPITQIDYDCDDKDISDCVDIGLLEYEDKTGAEFYRIRRFPANIKGVLNQLESGLFYKVKSFSKQDISAISIGNLSYNIKYDDVKSLTSNVTLPIDNGQDELIFGDSYIYNQRLHIFNLKYKMFLGYNFPIVTESHTNTFNTSGGICNLLGIPNYANCTLIAQILSQSDENFVVEKTISNPSDYFFFNNSNGTIVFNMPALFTYPTLDDVTLKIIIFDGTTRRVIFERDNRKSLINNISYHVNEVQKDTVLRYYFKNAKYASGLGVVNTNVKKESILTKAASNIMPIGSYQNIPTTISFGKEYLNKSNTMRLSNTNNPIVYPAINTYTFGDDKNVINAVCAMVEQLSETKFGMFPLYVFTNDGISAMEVGVDNIAYSKIVPLNIKRMINKNVVVNIGGMVFFLSDDGINLLMGREFKVISDLVKGKPDSQFIIDNIKVELGTDYGFIINDFSVADMLKDLENAKAIYDNKRNEVLMLCPNYTYVYNKKYQMFYKLSERFVNVHDILGEKYLEKKDNNIITLYSTDEDTEEVRSLVITKPISLESRQLKKIERLILGIINNATAVRNDSSSVTIWIYGSIDGENYKLFKYKKDIAVNEVKQDVYLTRLMSSFKYMIMAIATKQNACYMSGVDIEFTEVHRMGGIR